MLKNIITRRNQTEILQGNFLVHSFVLENWKTLNFPFKEKMYFKKNENKFSD